MLGCDPVRHRCVVFSLLAGACWIGFAAAPAAAATRFNVDAAGMSSYLIDGAADPTLTLTRGQTYMFTVVTVAQPIWITNTPGAGDAEANAYAPGVTNNGASPGTVTFVVPASAPATLFYQCAFHDPMAGTINIISPPPAPVPSFGPATLTALGGLLLFVAVAILRERSRGQNTMAATRCHDQ